MKKDNSITISSQDVKDFKGTYCDENPIIRDLLKKEFAQFFEGTILDVGGGTGDILSEVVPTKHVVHLDVLDFSDIAIPAAHTRLTGDFFDTALLQPVGAIDVLFMSHVHQFIDGDIEKLQSRIVELSPKHIILVEDMNDDFLGDVMRFSLEHIANANPEVQIPGFPRGYTKTKSVPFTATLTSPTFTELAKQCLYLMDAIHSDDNMQKMTTFLQTKLSTPTFTINQEINLYQK
jgi:trans-aconitate methyltransferase